MKDSTHPVQANGLTQARNDGEFLHLRSFQNPGMVEGDAGIEQVGRIRLEDSVVLQRKVTFFAPCGLRYEKEQGIVFLG